MRHFFNELWTRIKSDTPLFFVRLRAFGLSLAGIGTTFSTISNLPPNLAALGVKLIWIGGVIAAVSQLTVKNPDQK